MRPPSAPVSGGLTDPVQLPVDDIEYLIDLYHQTHGDQEGFGLNDALGLLKSTGYDLHAAADLIVPDPREDTIRAVIATEGATNGAAIKLLVDHNITAVEILRSGEFKLEDLIDVFGVDDIIEAGVTVVDLIAAGVTVMDLISKVELDELRPHLSDTDLEQFGFQ